MTFRGDTRGAGTAQPQGCATGGPLPEKSRCPGPDGQPQAPPPGYSETFFTNCDFSPIWPMPGILQSMS